MGGQVSKRVAQCLHLDVLSEAAGAWGPQLPLLWSKGLAFSISNGGSVLFSINQRAKARVT